MRMCGSSRGDRFKFGLGLAAMSCGLWPSMAKLVSSRPCRTAVEEEWPRGLHAGDFAQPIEQVLIEALARVLGGVLGFRESDAEGEDVVGWKPGLIW